MISISDKEFSLIEDYVKKNYGIILKNKRSLIEGRLANILENGGYRSYSQYFEHVTEDINGNALSTFIDRLTTNHTFFLREEQHFAYMRERVLPYLVSNSDSKEWRIWSAGCSSGEEPYTIAMIISDFLGEKKPLWDTRILATDISTKVLEAGMKGIYGREQVDQLPKLWKNNYFEKVNQDKCLITEKIRKEVIFRKLNFMDSVFSFRKKFHIIFCRNVMIYFDSVTKRELVRKLYDLTEPGGYLFIGHSESIDYAACGYKYILPSIFRKG